MKFYLLLLRATETTSLDLLAHGSAGLARQSKRLEELGASVKSQYLLTGPYDVAMLLSCDEDRFLAIELALMASGFSVEAFRAYTLNELDSARAQIGVSGEAKQSRPKRTATKRRSR